MLATCNTVYVHPSHRDAQCLQQQKDFRAKMSCVHAYISCMHAASVVVVVEDYTSINPLYYASHIRLKRARCVHFHSLPMLCQWSRCILMPFLRTHNLFELVNRRAPLPSIPHTRTDNDSGGGMPMLWFFVFFYVGACSCVADCLSRAHWNHTIRLG